MLNSKFFHLLVKVTNKPPNMATRLNNKPEAMFDWQTHSSSGYYQPNSAAALWLLFNEPVLLWPDRWLTTLMIWGIRLILRAHTEMMNWKWHWGQLFNPIVASDFAAWELKISSHTALFCYYNYSWHRLMSHLSRCVWHDPRNCCASLEHVLRVYHVKWKIIFVES